MKMQAVILAGGKGTRLRPYTNVLPKPLMPVGDMPILEVIIKQLKFFGTDRVIIAVGHLHHMIESFFKNGEEYGIDIQYSLENDPLGTAGPIGLIMEDLDENFLVINGDLLTNINFRNVFDSHINNDADATLATFERTLEIDFGLVETNDNSELIDYKEKPLSKYKVSMGINVFKKSSIIPILDNKQHIDIPDVMMNLVKQGKKVHCYSEECTWLDIGRIDDYNEAVNIFEENKNIYLPKK